MIKYVIYGNTEYLDILNIQTDYAQGHGSLTLFINENDLKLEDLYSKYDRVIFYDNNQTYATRLLNCMEQLDDEYVLFIHDIDILLKSNKKVIENLFSYLKINNLDRIDLKYSDKIYDDSKLIKINESEEPINWKEINKNEINDNIILIEQNDVNNFIYNVNPSIWKRTSFIGLLKNFKHKNYRTIEELDVQHYAKNLKVFKMFSSQKLNCGYFECVPIFVYLHISHSGKLLPLNNEFKTVYGQPYNDISEEYIKIVEKYNLRHSNKWIN